MRTTPTKLATAFEFHQCDTDINWELDIHPANASRNENASWRKRAPAMAVNIGDKNCKTVASESDRYCRE